MTPEWWRLVAAIAVGYALGIVLLGFVRAVFEAILKGLP